MNTQQLQAEYIKDTDIEWASRHIKESLSDTDILARRLKELDNMSKIIMKFELLRWVGLPLLATVAYVLSLHVFGANELLQQAAVYTIGMSFLGFGVLSHLINSNKVSIAQLKSDIAYMLAIKERAKK